MVLCKFFQQGSCRFGSKCANEHFDVKQVVKTDVEAAINGKQWPLSTYGPFKDKPSIPNFIDDQSFEEVRMLCYEAKQKNFFDQFHQQFNKRAFEASNKMKALLQMTQDIVDVVISVYDTPSDISSSGATGGKSDNNVNSPFGMGNSTALSAGSIFAKSSTNTPANNIFGNNNGGFSSSIQATPGIFGNASTYPNQPQQQTATIFGQATKPANSIFGGGANNTNVAQNNSIFGQQSQTNIFATATQPQQQTSIFSQQPQPQQNVNIFKQASQPQQGLFTQAPQTMQQQQQVIFAQASQSNMAQAPAAGQGLFAQAAQQTQNIFSQAMQQQQQPNANIFQQNQTVLAHQQQQTNTNNSQQNPPITAQQPIQNQQPATVLYQQTMSQTQNSSSQINQLTQVSSTLYSRLEDLTTDEVEAFKAECFFPGKIPFNPPPRELIH